MIHFKLTGLFLCVGGKGQNDLACVSLGMDNLKTTKFGLFNSNITRQTYVFFFLKEKNLKFVLLDFLYQIASQFENM